MSKPDAERALAIYKIFSKQTDQVVAFLSVGRQYENSTRLEIPKLKHAPTSLTGALEEYLNDPDFEINRRQYLAQKEAKRTGKPSNSAKDATSDFSKLSLNGSSSKTAFPDSKPSQAPAQKPEAKGPAPDLIDLFASIEQNQQPMGSQPQPQFTNIQKIPQYQFQQQPFQTQGQAPQLPNQSFDSTNPFASMVNQPQPQAPSQTNFVGIGNQPQQLQTTPFNPNQAMSPNQSTPFQQQPFAIGQPQTFPNGVQQQQQQQFTHEFQSPIQGQMPVFSSPLSTGGLQPAATGQQSTNPFRQSMMPQSTASTVQSFGTASPVSPQQNQQSTNPFRSFSPQVTQNGSSPFPTSAPPSSKSSFFSTQSLQSPQSMPSMPIAQPLQPARTGTNPFKSAPPSTFQTPTASPLVPQRTGTNPFRQSAFMNQQTGQGWQANQGTMGGLENLDTIPVFPRPTGQP